MHTVTDAFNSACAAPGREITSKILFNGTTELAASEVQEISITEQFGSSDGATIGAAFSSQCKVVIYKQTPALPLSGGNFTPYAGIMVDGAAQFVPNGKLGYNQRIAMAQAGYEEREAGARYKLMRDPKVRRYIFWLKSRALQNVLASAEDILDEWTRIAFADITNFVEIRRNSISLKPANLIDGQLVKTIKTTKDGVSIELYDKMKALDSLARYMKDMPKDWKQQLEERKVEIQAEELAIKKQMYELDNPAPEEDGFLAAVKESAKVVWNTTKGTE